MKPTTIKPIPPERATFDPNEQLASVFLSNVTDFKTRLNLRAVSTAFLNAEKQDASTHVDVGTTHTFGELCNAAGKFENAYEWFEKASEQDQGQSTFNKSASMFNLAVSLQNGEGVEKNLDEALKWCKRAAEAGSTEPKFSLATSFYSGSNGVQEDKAMAVTWLQRAGAESDRPDALAMLGHIFVHQRGWG